MWFECAGIVCLISQLTTLYDDGVKLCKQSWDLRDVNAVMMTRPLYDPHFEEVERRHPRLTTPQHRLITFVQLVIAGPILEETLCYFLTLYSPFLSLAVFILMHYRNAQVAKTMWVFMHQLVNGMAWGFIRHYGGLAVGILMHAIHNCVLVLVGLASDLTLYRFSRYIRSYP